MARRKFSREFKLEAVRLVQDHGLSVSAAARDLGLHPNVLGRWIRESAEGSQPAFPGHGKLRPEQEEIARLKRELKKAQAERDILKKATAYFAKESS
jgi:transposase